MLPTVRARVTDAVPTSSMADIAFLLLVFFLVTTVFPKDRGLGIVLPDIEAPDVPVNPENILQLLVRPDGVVEVRRGASTELQRVSAREVETVWRAESADNPALIAAVTTDAAAPYGRMVDVLDALRTAGADRISLDVIRR